MDFPIREALTIYGIGAIGYAGYIMISIYSPVCEELKYIVSERYGKDAFKYTKRFSLWYAFIAFLMAMFFFPYLAFIEIKNGHWNLLTSYKETLWHDIHGEIREGIRNDI